MDTIRVCHFASGDLWAGAEVQIACLLKTLTRYGDLELSAIIMNEGRLAEEIRQLKIPLEVLHENEHSALCLLIKVYDTLRQKQVTVLHTHRYKENVIGCLAGTMAGVPYLVRTVHGLPEPFHGFRRVKACFTRWLDYLAARPFTDRIITVSHDIRKRLSTCVNAERLIAIHNGIDVEQTPTNGNNADLQEALRIPQGAKIIGTAGRLVPTKGLTYLLDAAGLILEKYSDVRFLIVGDGPLMDELRRQAARLGIEQHVVFTGFREDIFDLINLMDVFVLPSLHEGIPMVLLEAMALRKPIVATEVGGIPEMLQNGETAVLVRPGDGGALADGCLTAFGLQGKEMADKAYERLVLHFSSELNASRTADVYRNLTMGLCKRQRGVARL